MGDRQGQVLLEKYRLDAMLGQGGMGSVYAGTNLRTGRRVAIKLLDERFLQNPSIVQRFGREARAASAIEHPGIVEVLDLDQTEEGVPFLVMEYLDGETLAARIEKKTKLSQPEVVEIFGPLLDALDAAHARGIVHRDIKPDNIYLLPATRTSGPRVKLLDFGISQKSDEVRSHLTQTGAVLGTPHYMSPEQALGEGDLDARADIYAIGVVLYECVVGDVPYDAPNYNALLQTILRHTPKRPRDRGAQIDVAVEDIIVRAMSKDRDERPVSAHALRDLLFAAAQPAAPSGPPGKSDTRGVSVRPAQAWGDAPTLKSGEPPRRPSPLPGKPPSVPPVRPSPPAPARASMPAGGRAFDDLDLAAGPALELDHAPIGRTSSADSTGPRRPVSGASFAALPTSVAPSRRPASSSAIPALPPDSLPPPPSPPSMPPAASQGSTPPIEARRSLPGPPPEPPKKSVFAFIPQRARMPIAIGLALLAVIVVIRLLVRPGTDVEEPVVAPQTPTGPASPARPDDLVSVEVVGLPPGAVVRLDGIPAATMPMRIRQGSHHVLTVTAPGYVQREIELTATGELHIPADMRPLIGTQ